MNRERLERAVAVLEAFVPSAELQFDIRMYCAEEGCGTAACAAGLCGLDPWFQKQGFRTEGNDVVFDDSHGLWAVEKFFDLSEMVTHGIFLLGGYWPIRGAAVGAADVAKKLRALLEVSA
jgi:hypothetical protein